MSAITKRTHDEIDAEQAEEPPAKVAKKDAEFPSHPYYILRHLVVTVLPAQCRSETSKAFYETELENPLDTVELCKGKLAKWVLDLWDKGNLHDYYHVKRHAAKEIPTHSVVYLCLYDIEGKAWRYVGQARNGHMRVVCAHQSSVHRATRPSFAYFLHDKAKEVSYLLPIPDAGEVTAPILNILEQWMSILFRSLQQIELKLNMSLETLRRLRPQDMQLGANVREPLGQGLGFNDFPPNRRCFRVALSTLRREWFQIHYNRDAVARQGNFLRGELFDGSFWKAPGWYGTGDYEFQIWSVKLRIGKIWIDRYQEGTVRVWCDLRPEGEVHPETISRGRYCRPDDPARRLGIKVSGIRKADREEGWCWLQTDGEPNKSIPRVNRLVDWLVLEEGPVGIWCSLYLHYT